MTITQMRYFKAVCQHMSLTKASRELHISQPALSMAIKEIEGECGVALFHRTANSLSITDQGIVLLEEINTILSQHEHLQKLLSSNLLGRNYVRIGLSTLNGNTVFPEIVSQFRRKHPDIQLFVTEGSTYQHYENLDNNKVDLIITDKNPKLSDKEWEESPIYGRIPLKQSYMVFGVSVKNPLSRQSEISWGDILKEPLILLNDSYSLTRFIKAQIADAGYEMPKNVYYTSQMYTVERFIEKNVAAGFMPAEAAMDNPRIAALNYPAPKKHWVYLVYRKDRYSFLSAKLFIQTAKEVFRNRRKKQTT